MSVRLGGPKFGMTEKDLVTTPPMPVQPLLQVLGKKVTFVEPCAGTGRLVRILEREGHQCVRAVDVEPRHESVQKADATDPSVWRYSADPETFEVFVDCAITNPPYSQALAVPLLDAMIEWPMPTWLLIPQRWLCNLWFQRYLRRIAEVVPVGKVKWVEGSKHQSTDDFIWVKIMRAGELNNDMWHPRGRREPVEPCD